MTERIVMIEKDCVNKKLSGNINEVIRAVLSPLFFFFWAKNFSHTKSTKRTKSTKTQPSKSTKRK